MFTGKLVTQGWSLVLFIWESYMTASCMIPKWTSDVAQECGWIAYVHAWEYSASECHVSVFHLFLNSIMIYHYVIFIVFQSVLWLHIHCKLRVNHDSTTANKNLSSLLHMIGNPIYLVLKYEECQIIYHSNKMNGQIRAIPTFCLCILIFVWTRLCSWWCVVRND